MLITEGGKFGVSEEVLFLAKKMGWKKFTKTQTSAIKRDLFKKKSLIISGPTSSGKTALSELIMVQNVITEGIKGVYLVSTKALAEEKFSDFKKRYDTPGSRYCEISIATGERSSGFWKRGILVATYEKYLALYSSGRKRWSSQHVTVVADELQILSDQWRGSNIELLCTLLMERKIEQFIGLSAVISNVSEISNWLQCSYVSHTTRDLPLREEIWYGRYKYWFKDPQSPKSAPHNHQRIGTLDVVNILLADKIKPLVVFTITKREARTLAQKFSTNLPDTILAENPVDQLELFLEETELSNELKNMARKRVAFHNADMTMDERTAIENALRANELDVVFATTTLAAGVNFPVRGVIFDEIYRWWNGGSFLSKSDYQNMAGRAGRLGFKNVKEGLIILLPDDNEKFYHAKELIGDEREIITSKMTGLPVDKILLSLISGQFVSTQEDLKLLCDRTLYTFQNDSDESETNFDLYGKCLESLDLLSDQKMISNEKVYLATQLGSAVAKSGLKPHDVIAFLNFLATRKAFAAAETAMLIYSIFGSSEYIGESGSYLPASDDEATKVALNYLGSIVNFDIPNFIENNHTIAIATHSMLLWIEGVDEKSLRKQFPKITYGQLHTYAKNISRIIGALAGITKDNLSDNPHITDQLRLLSKRVEYGLPTDVLDLMLLVKEAKVPGINRQTCMLMRAVDLVSIDRIQETDETALLKVLKSKKRVSKLLQAVSSNITETEEDEQQMVLSVLSEDKIAQDLVRRLYATYDFDYEDTFEEVMQYLGFDIRKEDVKGRSSAPDFSLSYRNKSILLECKTKKNNKKLGTNEALHIRTKEVNIKNDHVITVGKPGFLMSAINKLGDTPNISLLPNRELIQIVTMYQEKTITTDNIFDWMLGSGLLMAEDMFQTID